MATWGDYTGVTIMVFGFVAGSISFVNGALAIANYRSRVRPFMFSRLILFSGSIVSILSLLDLMVTLTDDDIPGLGNVLALVSGLGLVVVATAMIFVRKEH